MTTQTSKNEPPKRLPQLLAKAPTVDNLQLPPEFHTEDEAIEYLATLSSTRSLADWEAAYLLSTISTQYGDATFARACDKAKISRGKGGRLRWVGQTWPIDIVKRFKNLTFTHFADVTALMNEAYKSKDSTMMENLLDVLYQADRNPRDDGSIKSAEQVRVEAYQVCKGVDLKQKTDEDANEKPFTVRGMLLDHPGVPLSDGSRKPALVILLEDEASREYLVGELKQRGLYGQYVANKLSIDDTE